jgi:prophage tail gpP-like protein
MCDISVNNHIIKHCTLTAFQNSLGDLRSCICSLLNDGETINVYDKVEVRRNGKIFLTGVVKAITQTGSERTIFVKSFNGILKDTCAPTPIEFANCNLRDIIDKVCNEHNLKVIYNTDLTAYPIDNGIGISASAGLTENAWDFLVRLCFLRGLLLRDTEDGLVIGKLRDKKDYHTFTLGQNSITNYNQVHNYDGLARTYEVYGQFNGNHRETLTLPFVKQNTTKRIINNEVNGGLLKDFLRWYVCREIGRAVKVTLTITKNDDLNIGDFVCVKDNAEEKKYIIERIDETIQNGIVLTLVLPCAYTGEVPEGS